MKKLTTLAVIALMSFTVFSAETAKTTTSLITSIRSVCTVAGGEWDANASVCLGAKKDVIGTPCGTNNLGVIMYSSNKTKYCCQALDVNVKGDQYSVKCNHL